MNSEKSTKYLSKILSVDLRQIVDSKASELMHRHCDIYKPLIKGIRECFDQRGPQFENLTNLCQLSLLEFSIALLKLFSFETWNPFKSTYSLKARFLVFVCLAIFWMTKILCVVCNTEMAKQTKIQVGIFGDKCCFRIYCDKSGRFSPRLGGNGGVPH